MDTRWATEITWSDFDFYYGTKKADAPPLPQGYDKHHVVYLEEIHCPLPKFDFDYSVEIHRTSTQEDVRERIKNATIVIATVIPILPVDMDHAPNLQLIAVLATGIGWIDRDYCAKRGITVVNCPQSNVEAVGEHFLTLYFSSRRKVPEIHRAVTETDEWTEKRSLTSRWTQGPPLSCAKEVLGIIGYGHLGKRFEELAKAVGFGKIIISERKGVQQARRGRVTLKELIRSATTIVVCCPREPKTIDLIGEKEIAVMKKECLIINMARGGIVNEQALADALKEGRIFGAATDVMDEEPSPLGSSPLVPDIRKGAKPVPNLIISPHVAWFAQQTLERLQDLLKDGVNRYVHGRLQGEHGKRNVVVHNGRIVR